MRNEGKLKSNKGYKIGFWAKLGATAVGIAILIGSLFSFVGCGDNQIDKPGPDRPGIIVPDDPNKEDPGKEEPGTEDPGKEEPGTEEPGKEEPGTEEPGTEDPGKEEPGTEEPGTEEPGTEEPGDDPVIDPPEPELPDSLDELFAEGNEEYVDVVSDTLNDNLYEKIINKTISNNVENIKDARWEIVSADGVNIDMIRIFAFNDISATAMSYNITNVVPKTTITIADLVKPDTTKLEKAFDTAVRGGAKYSREYGFSFNPSIQKKRAELKDAVNAKLAKDGIIQQVTQDTQSFIVDDGANVDTILTGTARRIVVLNINGNRVEEYTIRIKENQANNNDTTLIENLNKNNYYNVEAEHVVLNYTQNHFENEDLTNSATAISYKVVYVDPEDGTTSELEL